MSPCVSPLMLALSPLEAFAMPAGVPLLPPQHNSLLQLHSLQSVAATLEASNALGLALAALHGRPDSSPFRLSGPSGSDTLKQPSPRHWQEPLQELKSAPAITLGSTVELSSFKEFVRSRILESLSAARASAEWRDSGLPGYLSKALQLVDDDCTLLARQQAVELLGFEALAHSSRATATSTTSGASTGVSTASAVSPSSSPGVFKVPAPVRASSNGGSPTSQHHNDAGRRHGAPKRRPTPQVLEAPPHTLGQSNQSNCNLADVAALCGPGALSGSSSKRQRVASPAAGSPVAARSAGATSSSVGSVQCSSNGVAPQLHQQQHQTGTSSPASTSSSGSLGAAHHGVMVKPPTRRHADVIEAVKVAFHKPSAATLPAAEALVLSKERQTPMACWEGPVKHRQGGEVVELCSMALQVPQVFHEQFPPSLFALEICHRRQVSLGDHVVCRAALRPLNEHQMVGLTAMAKHQLVLVVALQTAELHLVPYFDNKEAVRLVGFLRVHAA